MSNCGWSTNDDPDGGGVKHVTAEEGVEPSEVSEGAMKPEIVVPRNR